MIDICYIEFKIKKKDNLKVVFFLFVSKIFSIKLYLWRIKLGLNL